MREEVGKATAAPTPVQEPIVIMDDEEGGRTRSREETVPVRAVKPKVLHAPFYAGSPGKPAPAHMVRDVDVIENGGLAGIHFRFELIDRL